jgi:predicted kinase
MARWHLVAGSTGAGKSTAAREIAERVGGVRFSMDEWMSALYWMDCPEKNDLPWALERVGRCEAQIAAVAGELAGVGVSSVLDLGFTQRSQRMEWLKRAQAVGVECVLHVLDVDAEVRWGRVCERNRGEGKTFTFEVTREMFEFMEARWELPGVEEREMFGPARTGPARTAGVRGR